MTAPATPVQHPAFGTVRLLRTPRRAAVLVEVKLAEAGFTECRGRGHPDKARHRRYREIFATDRGLHQAFPGAGPERGCPFAGHAYQPMRNLAAADALVQDPYSAVSRAWFVLCAHHGNPEIAEQWSEWRAPLPDPRMAPALPASDLVRAGDADGHGEWAAWMRARYLFAETPEATAGTPCSG